MDCKAKSTKSLVSKKGSMTKVERKALREEQKRVLKVAWGLLSDNSAEKSTLTIYN